MWSGIGASGDIAIHDVEPFELRSAAFRVDAPTKLLVNATTSLENDAPGAAMAATAWIIKRGDVKPVWQTSSENAQSRRGSLVRTSEMISLEPGIYDAYFSSYGNDIRATGGLGFFHRIFGSRTNWTSDEAKWGLTISAVEGQPPVTRLDPDAAEDDADAPGVVWRTAPMRSNDAGRKVFEIGEPIDLHIRAIGELSSSGRDYGWIDNLSERRRVWELTPDNTVPAGGHSSNRLFDATIRLEPGVYAAGFETDPSHAPDFWRANPPFNPKAWGITMTTAPEKVEAIKPFDPQTTRTPLLELTRVGTDQHDRVDFSIAETLDVVVEALGEISSSQQYDYGWIENESGERVWEMRYANTSYAGGDRYNREALEILQLVPGSYSAHFRTDDSHAYGDWRKGQPRNSERWGMTLYPLRSDPSEGSFAVMQRVTNVPTAPEPPEHPAVSIPHLPGLENLPQHLSKLKELMPHMAVQIRNVGNGANLRETFNLSDPQSVIVIAQGELLPTDKYDYAWIERADNGETVWSMSWDNTHPAGGDDRNRMFTGSVDLPAGQYVVRYRSDPSHAFGDFGKISPAEPDLWGVTVVVPPSGEVVTPDGE